MASEKIELTEEGIAKLKTEYRHLIDIDRPQVLDDLKTARNQGDLSENADYDAARNRQAEIEGRIKEIEAILASAIVIREKSKNNKSVSLGSKVELKDLSDNSIVSYTVVGTIERSEEHSLNSSH